MPNNKSFKDHVLRKPEIPNRYTIPRVIPKSTFVPMSLLLGDETVFSPDRGALSNPEETNELIIPSELLKASIERRDILKDYKSLDVSSSVRDALSNQEETKELIIPSKLTRSSLAPGDVFYGFVLSEQSTREPFLDYYDKKMEERSTGYLSIAFETLCEQLAFMPPKHISELVTHMDVIISEMQVAGRLQWLGQPMTSILRDLSIMLSGGPSDILQLRAMVFMSLMRNRRKIIGEDVNDVLDFADSLINIEGGEHLLRVMEDFKNYPNVTKSGREMCIDVIEAFETPFLLLSGAKSLQQLVKSANQAFANRFPQYSHFRTGTGDFPGALRPKMSKYSFTPKMVQSVVRFTQPSIHPNVTSSQKQHKNPSKHKGKLKPKRPTTLKGPTKYKGSTKQKGPSKVKHPSKNKGKHHSKHKRPPKNNQSNPQEVNTPSQGIGTIPMETNTPKLISPAMANTRLKRRTPPNKKQNEDGHCSKDKISSEDIQASIYSIITSRKHKYIRPDLLFR